VTKDKWFKTLDFLVVLSYHKPYLFFITILRVPPLLLEPMKNSKNSSISNNWPIPKPGLEPLNRTSLPQVFKGIIWLLCFVLPGLISFKHSYALEDKKTQYIYMVKTAEVEGHIYDIDNKRVQAQTYIVQKGDSLWRILRKKRLLNQGN
jgi:hypothetical protein